MNFVPSSTITKSQIKVPSFNATIVLSSLALLIVLALAVYVASGAPGMSPDELALTAVFP